MNEYLIAAMFGAMAAPAYTCAMSFILWENAFKQLGWKFFARLSLVLAVAVPLLKLTN